MSGIRFSKLVVAINGGVPLAILLWDWTQGKLGADPTNFAIKTTGLLALIFLMVSLAITPIRRLSGWSTLVGYRRSLGLYGFGYACVHLLIYITFDRHSLAGAASEIVARVYLQIGFAAIVLMAPLAITSTDGMIRRLGPKRWKFLHRLAYAATILGAIHYYMQSKSDVTKPEIFLGILGVMLVARAIWHFIDLPGGSGASKPSKAVGQSVAMSKPVGGSIVTATAQVARSRKFWQGELRVARTFDETSEVRTFRLVPENDADLPFDYKPGQYLTLRLMVDGKPVNRSYTIASSPTRRGYCELTVKREEMGVSSGHLHRQIRAGDRLKIAAPAGKFVFTGTEAQSVVLIAGGVGITPMMSILRYLTDHAWPGDIYFVFAAREEKDIIFRAELEQLASRFPNLHLCITLSRAPADGSWKGERGRITPVLLTRLIPELPLKLVYLCGPNDMMSAVQKMLGELGLPEANLKLEAFVSAAASQVMEPDATAAAAGVGETASSNGSVQESTASAEGERTVEFTQSGRAAMIADGVTVLEAAESAGVEIPYECRAGVCGQCKTKLAGGMVKMESQEALSPSEKKEGWILACQAIPTTANVAVGA